MTKHHQIQEREASDRRLDTLLRRALEPAPGSAERVARKALETAPEPESSFRSWFVRPAVVAIALLALVAGAALMIPRLVTRPTDNLAIHTGLDRSVPDPASESPAPSRLSISNADGTVTVTTPGGTRWIALPRDESVRNGG